jgi:hypothetical protein
MVDDVIYSAGDVSITSKVARLNQTTYQVANISSVAIENSRRMNTFALLLIFFGIGIFTAGLVAGIFILGTGLRSDLSIWFYAVGLAFIVIGIAVQLIWPRRCFVLNLKTTSGDVEALTSEDGAHIGAVQRALEQAFAQRP